MTLNLFVNGHLLCLVACPRCFLSSTVADVAQASAVATIASSRSAWPCSNAPAPRGCVQTRRAGEARWRCGTASGCGCPSVGQDAAEGGACWRMKGAAAVAKEMMMGADVGTSGRRIGVSVGAFEKRMGVGASDMRTGVEVEAFYWKMSGEGGVLERVVVVAVESSEKTDEAGEACERSLVEGEGEAWEKSSAVGGEAGGKRSGGEVVVEGMKTTVEGGAEGRRRWAEVGEAARHLHLCPCWLRRNTGSPFSWGVSGNRGTERRCPVAAGLPGVCPPTCRRLSCVR